MRPIALTLPLVLLGGCASRGAMTFDCRLDGEMDYAYVAPQSKLVRDLENDRPVVSMTESGSVKAAAASPGTLDSAIDGLFTLKLSERDDPEPNNVLLLSGGGQWGAYGAGFLQWIAHKDGALPRFRIVTGISTGALQALYLGALEGDNAARKARLADMARSFAPASEKEIVDRGSLFSAVLKGSVAGLAPLRGRIQNALCPPKYDTSLDCPLIETLATTRTATFVGFVDAQTGKFIIAPINRIAQFARVNGVSTQPRLRQVRDCLTGVAMASAAVPVFYQQVKIDGTIKSDGAAIPPGPRTMYDGGVRHSVFEVQIAKRIDATEKGIVAAGAKRPALYVLRNGPTTAEEDDKVQTNAGALVAAQRGYGLLVNQSEVASIEALRLVRPTGDIYFSTANGFAEPNRKDPAPPTGDEWQRPVEDFSLGCHKATDGTMFDRKFMRCLQALGRAKADGATWSTLDP